MRITHLQLPICSPYYSYHTCFYLILNRFWRLSLPAGENRDHPFANPFGPASPRLESLALDPILVVVGGSELLKDRAEDYAKRLKELGKKIEYVEFEGKQHGFFTHDPFSEVANEAIQIIRRFMLENSNQESQNHVNSDSYNIQ